MRFEEGKPNCEVAMRGLCQLLIECFRDFYDFVRKPLGLKKFGEELMVEFLPDNSYVIRKWEHLAYCTDSDLIEDRAHLAIGRNTKQAHTEYFQKGF